MKNLSFSASIFAMLVASTWPTHAKILIDQSVNVRLVPNFWYAPMAKDNSTLLAFVEAEEVALPDGSFPVQPINRWDHLDEEAGLVLEDATVDSHMLYFQMTDSKERRSLVAEIEFDRPIIGLIADCQLFDRDTEYFAPAPTHKKSITYKPDGSLDRWSLEEKASWTPLDKVTMLSPTRIRVEFTNHSATDALRVLTLRSGSANRPYSVE